ncbi:MAG TPA: NADH-ubiquinone oxidoreductase-F iron-sulfur binding region domain-containing protein [Acidimicrobiia bacterium]
MVIAVVFDETRRLLPSTPLASLDEYCDAGGGRGLAAARAASPDDVIAVVSDAGLRGRGGAGFPTGRKWATVAANRSPAAPTTLVVNAAEGEPGTFKDRAILRANPYVVLEGALVAAHAVGAPDVVVAMKASFRKEALRVRAAIKELDAAGWCEGTALTTLAGPDEYLYGEETALLEVLDGRHPFPRIAPPFRWGALEVVESPSDLGSDAASAARVQLAGPTDATVGPPTLVNNTETLANVPGIVARGPSWFRAVGTADSPGTVVCTVSGRTARHGVAEVPMGTPLAEVLRSIGGGPVAGHELTAVLPGVANRVVPRDRLATPVSYEAFEAIGSGVGSAGFIVCDDTTDLLAVAAAAARFLAVESCGQCTPCKQDGLAVADHLTELVQGRGVDTDVETVAERLTTITTGARCFLATQHQRVVESLLELVGTAARPTTVASLRHLPILPIADLVGDEAVLDERQAAKQPDWTYDAVDSGRSPADRLDEHRTEAR